MDSLSSKELSVLRDDSLWKEDRKLSESSGTDYRLPSEYLD